VVTDQHEINTAATSHLRRWFEESEDVMPGSLGGPKAVWQDAFASRDTFLSRTQDSGIPEERRAHL
jgi:hypothetical protein